MFPMLPSKDEFPQIEWLLETASLPIDAQMARVTPLIDAYAEAQHASGTPPDQTTVLIAAFAFMVMTLMERIESQQKDLAALKAAAAA